MDSRKLLRRTRRSPVIAADPSGGDVRRAVEIVEQRIYASPDLVGALNALEQGYASMLLGYCWYELGRKAVEVLVDDIKKSVKPADPIYAKLLAVDQSNVVEYQRRQYETGGRS